jgi:hypothetical protein
MFKRRDKKSGSDSLDKDKLEKEKKKLAKKEAKAKTSSGSLPTATTTTSPASSPTKPALPAATATAVPALKLGQQRPAAVPLRPASATPSQHGPIAVPPRPGNAGHILGAAYSTRSNVPVLRVPLTPHVLPSMTAHRLSADASATVQSHSAQPFVPLTERADATTTASGASTTAWRNGAAGDSASSLATTAAATTAAAATAAAGSQGRLRAASVSSGSGEAATPAEAATANDRRKSLLSPMTPQQMKAALRNDEFSYFAEVEDKGVFPVCAWRVACAVVRVSLISRSLCHQLQLPMHVS